jgi:hypothetical protein
MSNLSNFCQVKKWQEVAVFTRLCNWIAVPVHGAKSWKHCKISTLITSVSATLGWSSPEATCHLPLCFCA